jgi:hypothetical protein
MELSIFHNEVKMKKLMTLGVLAIACTYADEIPTTENNQPEAKVAPSTVEASHGYLSLGLGPFPIPMPIFGIGGRFQKGHHGFDVSVQATTVISLTVVKENFLYLHYFKPNLASQFYVGGGFGITEIFQKFKSSHQRTPILASPQFIFGKEYTNDSGDRRFFQAQVDFPFVNLNSKHDRIVKFPAVVVSYGICF